MTNLMSMAKDKFKTTRKKSTSNNLAKKKNKSRKSSSTGSGAFSGKLLGFKIPIISDVLRNRNVQKALAATGLVTTVLTVAAVINNPTVNKFANNEIVKLGLAGAAGDVVGVGTQLLLTRGLQKVRGTTTTNGGNQMLLSQAGNGVA